ncbi:carbamoyltransferase HypF [Muricomes intestini]|jgi:hydrogenase maturation protein HypF|uniref:carbamoyltransferase HypF n=1 Tax=Muricomes intestini TaxID=1796634 RepID=UPI002FDDCB58
MDKREFETVTNKVLVSGIVQGVGFRPLTFRLAEKYNIRGTVQNKGGMVEIIAQSSQSDFEAFIKELKNARWGGCEIVNLAVKDITESKPEQFTEFRIIGSTAGRKISIIPPDLAVCDKCREEMYQKSDRRYLHPFISCMSCGPRYTIIDCIPYDRENTVMEDFVMCKECGREYKSPSDRRFHAQTISCHECGPRLIFRENRELKDEEAYARAAGIIKQGGIIAVKGIGGYHFVCSPFIEETVQNLRKLKGREEKPFAVMFGSVSEIEEYCHVTEKEKILLESGARPIVLLYSDNQRMAFSTYKGSVYCGAFLPYTPLQIMLIKDCGPLIMTSGNISDQPIIREDAAMLSLKSPLLDGVLYNERRILRSVDDSVAKIVDKKPQLIRRSRGYVPYPVFLQDNGKNMKIFAAGGDLKAAFCLYQGGSAVVSQYFGDLEEAAVFDEYKASVGDLGGLLQMTPELAVCDMHPGYLSSKYAETLGLPLLYVQHHHAHIASVMAEHHMEGKVLGIAFDGTGYGTDGHVWGSEFMICEGGEFKRAAHLTYTPVLGGDPSMKDAKKTAACFLLNSGLDRFINDDRSGIIKSALDHGINTILTSSMGRLFDAAASMLEIADVNSYEGKCAVFLEKEALLAEKNHIRPRQMSFGITEKEGELLIEPGPVLETLGSEWSERKEEDEKALRRSLALGFHCAVAEAALKVCLIVREKKEINQIALSGGVFQNSVLTEHLIQLLRKSHFEVYYNMAVPPNDGSVSLGQAYIGLMKGR